MDEGVELSLVPCKAEDLEFGLNLGAKSREDVAPTISLSPINNIVDSSSDWILEKVNKIRQCVEIKLVYLIKVNNYLI